MFVPVARKCQDIIDDMSMKVLSIDWRQPYNFFPVPQFHGINEQRQMAMWVVFLILEYCNLVKTAIGKGLNLKFIRFP